MPIDEQLGVFSNYKPRIRAAWIGPCSWDVADVPTSAATVLPRVVVDLSLIGRINWKGSASIAVPNAAGNRAPGADLLIRRRKAARTQRRVYVTRLLWLLRGASGRASLLVLSGGERAALAVAPLALIAVSSCLGPSTVNTLALRPDGHQHEQQPGRNGRGSWRRHIGFPVRFPERKLEAPLK
jgi:hypothetical protein